MKNFFSYFSKTPKEPINVKMAKIESHATNKFPLNPSKHSESLYLEQSDLIYSCVDYISKTASQAIPTITSERPNKYLSEWIISPNPYQPWSDYIELLIQGLLLTGTSFLSFEKYKNRYESWFLGTPIDMEIVTDDKNYISGYLYKTTIPYAMDECIAIKNPTINNRFYGQPTVKTLLDMLNLESFATQDLQDFYRNGSLLSGIIKSEYPLSNTQSTDIRDQFNTLYATKKGVRGGQRGGVAVFPNGLTFEPIQSNPTDSKVLDSLQIPEARVYKTFKINPLVLGGGGVTSVGTNPEEVFKTTFNVAVRPYLYKLEDNINLFLRQKFKDNTINFKFDFSRITELETSLDTRAEAARVALSSGILSLNEARKWVGKDPIDVETADFNVLPTYLYGDTVNFYQTPQSTPLVTPTPPKEEEQGD
jgi:HK97 family phage portal protein